jgi:molybdopterin/thiamine biosynthesis adenylyltransferase
MARILLLALIFWVLTGPWLGKRFGRKAMLTLSVRMAVIFGGYIVVLGITFVSPGQMFGGSSLIQWMSIGIVGAAVGTYFRWLDRLRSKAEPGDTQPIEQTAAALSEFELQRYARHIVLREIGGLGQKNLSKARVLVIGAGGLGSPALQYLAAAGVGTIGIIDDDTVDLTNLQRQIIHTDDRTGMDKVRSAQLTLEALNPHVDVRPYKRRFTEDIALDLVSEYDVILDGSDNFDTRYLVNRMAVASKKPLVSGALSQWEGQLSVFDPAHGTPCYACIFPDPPSPGLAPSCAAAGVLGPLPGVIGSMMAVETVKLICDAGQPLHNELLIYDALWGETRKINLKRRPDCQVCGSTGLSQTSTISSSSN